jgi:hypothetical protein
MLNKSLVFLSLPKLTMTGMWFWSHFAFLLNSYLDLQQTLRIFAARFINLILLNKLSHKDRTPIKLFPLFYRVI